MLISLNWLKDFVDVPPDLNPQDLALRFTLTTAEVEGVEHFVPDFAGLVAARIESIRANPGEDKLKTIIVDAGKKFTSLTTAPDLDVGDLVIYAPPNSVIAGHSIGTVDSAGRPSEGMVVAGQSIGLMQVGANAIFLPGGATGETPVPQSREASDFRPGQEIDRCLFDDWIIEVDNKSITHRPDCWGHYGIAREMAAMLDVPLKPYPVTDRAELKRGDLPETPIEIDDPALCPRYTGLLMKGLKAQPAPLWMQVRLALCGQRPIDLLVDLTNYVMLELGQPMHAFDGAALPNIQVATAAAGERFTTLDDVTRTMPPDTLMIQCNRKSVALAGIMGGAATEVSRTTNTVFLESANFDAATVRRAATAMGHRTEASARFEKSLDPEITAVGIARFHKLAGDELDGLELASTLSDCYPAPKKVEPIDLDCAFAVRIIGKTVSRDEIAGILAKLEFKCEPKGDGKLRVLPPSFRATKDIEIEADLIEEVARFIGYNNIEPVLPTVSARFFEKSPELVIEERTLDYLCVGGEFAEVHNYIWNDDDWLKTLGYSPGECLTLKNPASKNCPGFRGTLVPGLLAMAERNRHYYDRYQLLEIGTVFEVGRSTVEESQHRNLGLVAVQSGKKSQGEVWDRLRVALDGWGRQVLEARVAYKETQTSKPWEDADRIAEILVEGRPVGRVTILPLACKQRIDERLKAWSIALAELNLSAVAELTDRYEKLPTVPRYPQVEQDFSFLVDSGRRFTAIAGALGEFAHPLLRRMSFVGAYEGGSVTTGDRSLTIRAEIGRRDRTLTDEEIRQFQQSFGEFLVSHDMKLRGA